MCDASQASARVEHEARSHRRVAGGLGSGKGSGAGDRPDMRRATANSASRDAPLGTICPRTNNEETRLLRVSQERKWDPPVSDTLCTYEG